MNVREPCLHGRFIQLDRRFLSQGLIFVVVVVGPHPRGAQELEAPGSSVGGLGNKARERNSEPGIGEA